MILSLALGFCIFSLVLVQRHKRVTGNHIMATPVNIATSIMDPAEAKRQSRSIRMQKRKIRWAYRRLAKPYLCKPWTRTKARRFLSEASQSQYAEVRGTLRVYLNWLCAKTDLAQAA